jgi:ABC-2 type transport system ATP-binding protein
MNTALSLKNVTKLYGNKRGINGVNLEINQGEIFGFLGPNGAGKTTTIRCLMDFIRPQEGAISILGLDAHNDSVAIKRRVGFLAADPMLYPKWTGRDYLDFYKQARGSADVSDLVKRLDLDLHVQFEHLSSGNKQKLAFILALYGTPDLLIMDEPTKALDPLLQQEIYAILHEYRASGGTVFVSSHNLPEVEKICDRVGVIKEGRIVANETMQHIRDLAIHIVSISSETPLKEKDFKATGTEITHSGEKHMVLKVKGDLNPLLKKLAGYKIKDLEINHTNLEDIFMEYYK